MQKTVAQICPAKVDTSVLCIDSRRLAFRLLVSLAKRYVSDLPIGIKQCFEGFVSPRYCLGIQF